MAHAYLTERDDARLLSGSKVEARMELSRPKSGLPCFLFIYLVRDPSGGVRFCSVLAYGRNLEVAERIAINRVHQQGLHIVRADTATAAPWLDPDADREYLDELTHDGSALRLHASGHAEAGAATGLAANAA